MKKIYVTENQFKKIVSEALHKPTINESFASNAIRQAVMSNGGIAEPDEEGSPVGWKGYSGTIYGLAGILDKLTDEDLIYRALHMDEFDEVLYVRCKNGTTLTIPVTYEEYSAADSKSDIRSNYSQCDDGKYNYQPESEKYNI